MILSTLSSLLLTLCAAAPAGAEAGLAEVCTPGNAWLAQDPPAEEQGAESEQEEAAEAGESAEPEADPEPNPYLAIVGGEVHTVTGGVLARATVLCKSGRILKIGPRVRIPEGAEILDAHGMRVYPGLVAVESFGILRGRGPSIADSFDPFALNVDLGLAGGLTTVQTGDAIAKLTRGTLDGHLLATAPWTSLSYGSTSPSARRKLRQRLEGAQEYLRKVREVEIAKQLGEKDTPDVETKGVDMEAVKLLKGEKTARFRANSAKDLLAICDLLESYPMRSVIFGGREAWTLAPRLSRAGARLVITPRAKSWADDRLNRPNGWSIENGRVLWDTGVEFAILPGQTSISLGGLAGRDLLTLPMEVAFAIRGGLNQDAALRSITLDAARILGVSDRIGSLEVGKDADLIITDGDLFDYRTFVQWAVVNGRIAYDKQQASYFAHIRPRPEATAEEVAAEIADALIKAGAADDGGEGGEGDGPR